MQQSKGDKVLPNEQISNHFLEDLNRLSQLSI